MKAIFNKPVGNLFIMLLLFIISGSYAFCQTPQTFNYQAVLRDGSGNPMVNSTVGIQLIIMEGSISGTEIYEETHNVTTNELGMVTLELGSKHPEEFSVLNWTRGPYFLKVSVNGNVMGTSPLLSVPFALVSKTFEHMPFPYSDSTQADDTAMVKVKNLGTGKTFGLFGEVSSTSGVAVRCQAPIYGLWSETTGERSRAVVGLARNKRSIGVYGIALAENSTGVFGEGQNYDFYANGPGVDYGSGSSIRWKTNIAPINSPIEKIKAIRGVTFDWDGAHGGRHDVGMIAEEVGKVLPEIVVYEKNGTDAIGMDYSKITPLLLEAIKAQQVEIDALKAEISKLTSAGNLPSKP
jgi:hypothetical protein